MFQGLTRALGRSAMVLFAALLSAVSLSVIAQVSQATIETPVARDLDQKARAIIATGHVSGMAMALLEGDQIVLAQGYGARVLGEADAVDLDTVFRLASVSKTFSSSLLGLLAERRYLELSTPVLDLVPALRLKDPASTAELTVEEILSHRSGLPYHALDKVLEASDSFLTVRPQLAKLKLACKVGECYAYQNVMFDFATDVVVASTGQGFEQALNRELLAPLGMTRTTVGREALLLEPNHAKPHAHNGKALVAFDPKPNYYWMPAAAGINTSLRDLMRWAMAQQGYRPDVLSRELLDDLHRARVTTPGELLGPKWRRLRLQDAGYALGFRVLDYGGHEVIFHAGAVAGYRAMMALDPERQRSFLLMWNCNSALPAGLLPTALDHWFGLPPEDWLELNQYQIAARTVSYGVEVQNVRSRARK